MSDAVDFSAGGYRFIPGVFQYSGGAAALPGHEIQRVRFRRPVPLKQGFERIERIITEAGRPLTSFCACELRSPAPFTEQGFRAFNEIYVVTLEKWGLFDGKVNPVARKQCLSRDRSARRALVPRLLIHRCRGQASAELRDCRWRRGEGGRRKLQRAHHPARRIQSRRDA
jgi:hypothetical protein